MQTFWCVTSTINDRGEIHANIVGARECDKRPENACQELSRCDVYHDWFDSEEEAMQFVEDARKA